MYLLIVEALGASPLAKEAPSISPLEEAPDVYREGEVKVVSTFLICMYKLSV